MGVTGLWKLIEASGKPVPLETLENKVLAIDISIWLHQVVKGYQDNKGGYLPNAHLLGLFNRICKLLYFRIKPIFVFDGQTPQLKLQTIAKRAQSKSKIQNEADRLEQLLLESLAKEKIVQQALGVDAASISPSKMKPIKPSRTEERDDMFMLPPLKEEIDTKSIKKDLDEENYEEQCPKKSYDVNIDKIDVNSSHFKSLPADIRHDILTDIKETRKQNTWAKLRELPVESNDFSSYQMSRLLKRRAVQVSLDEAQKEMGGKCWSLSELESLLTEDGVLEVSSKHAQKIAACENTRFLLVRDIAKAISEAKKEPVPGTSKDPQPSTSKEANASDDNADELDFDLQRAIQLSLGNDVEPQAEEKDDIAPVKLSAKQRQKFGETIEKHGLIRGYMMEYAEMNDTDIQDLMQATQILEENDKVDDDSIRAKFPHIDEYVLHGTPEKKKPEDFYVISDSDSDGDQVKSKSLVITVDSDLKSFSQEDDLFADVFQPSAEIPQKSPYKDKDVPDVEVASIASSDGTLPYDVPNEDAIQDDGNFGSEIDLCFEADIDKPATESTQESLEKVLAPSENEKFWSNLKEEPITTVPLEKPVISENEKFWTDEVIEKSAGDAAIEKVLVENHEKPREESPPPKMASPFFVNRKTPSSKKKLPSPEPSTGKRLKVAKNLFSEALDVAVEIQKAADDLREKKTSDELKEMKDDLHTEQKNLAQERNKLDRMGMSITESMSRDCKDLLKLFGIPYVEAPMEAEAQCAFLNHINLTDGTISDDSDIWLFGGQTVFRNFFVQKKMVTQFKIENIEKMFHLNRKKLIQLAMLVGSDYTVGINGIGAVTALEILAAFQDTPQKDGETDEYQSIISSLRKFREWFQNGKSATGASCGVLKSKLRNIELFEGFPNMNVARAYLEPVIDADAEKFTWGSPDSESLIEYAKMKLGWTRMKTEEILKPVIKRLDEKKQKTIKDYFKEQSSKKVFDNQKMSKRVQKAVGQMAGDVEEDTSEANNKKSRKRAPATKKLTKKAREEIAENLDGLIFELSDDDEPPVKKSPPKELPSTSKSISNKTAAKSKEPVKRKRKPRTAEPKSKQQSTEVEKRTPRIPETKQIIPQREKDKEALENNKKKAIELFMSSISTRRVAKK